MNILIFIIILFVLVLAHEWGHYIVAKKNGIRVDEFGFGYPPRAMKMFHRNGTDFTLNWLPFGGFVKIFGENPDEENTNGPDKAHSFVHKSGWVQASVLVAGVVMNFLVAWLLLSIGFMTGLPTSVGSEPSGAVLQNTHLMVGSVLPGSPAESAGLLPGDKVDAVIEGSRKIENPDTETFRAFVLATNEKPLTLEISRGKKDTNVTITPTKNENGESVIGISMDMVGELKLPIHKALWEGLRASWHGTVAIVLSLYHLVADSFVGQADLSSIAGPVGIVKIVGQAYTFGFIYLLSFTAMISLNLAVINLLPFPALDGGRLFFLAIEKITRRKIPVKVFNYLNGIGFILLIALMLFVTYNDIVRLVVK